MENVEKLLKQILESQTVMQKDITSMQKDIHELKKGQTDLQAEVNMIKDQTSSIIKEISDFRSEFKEFEALNATRHTDMYIKLEAVGEDIDFLKHEENQTKQDVYKMRKKLEIIK